MELDELKTFDELWIEFGDIPINEREEIEEPFLHFPEGTDRFEIWHWFEEEYDVTLGDKFN